jgi:branched-chain amino acid transport system substrate-binding protein
MRLSRRSLLGSAATLGAAAALPFAAARAQAATIKVGVLTDMSGPYQDIAGPGAIAACQQAADEIMAANPGIKVEMVSADHQNKTDVGSGVARQWFDRDGVDVILEVANSGVSLAVAGVAKEKNKVFLGSGAASSDLTGKSCNANTIHWVYDTYMLAKSTGSALVKAGGDSWFFLTADYAFGHALERDVGDFVKAAGGKVLGAVRTPFPGTTDFSTFLIQAQASGAKVLGLANAGADTINSIKQAKEFGVNSTMKLAGLLVFLTDVHSLGLDTCQGMVVSESFYWDLNPGTRAFSERFTKRAPGKRPTMVQAGVYSSLLHYAKAAGAMGVAAAKAEGAAMVAKMKSMPTDDECFGKGSIREDGRKIHPAYLFEVKKPSESKAAWDYYKLLATTPADEAFRPIGAGGCSLVKA